MRKFRNIVMMFALILSVSLVGCKEQGSVPVPKGSISISSKVVQKTLKGAEVHSEKGGVTAEQLAMVDAGLDQAIADAKASGWADNGTAYDHKRYQIYIPVDGCKPSPESQTPSFLVGAKNYDGSIYDQHNTKGELPAAEQTDFWKYVKDDVGVVYAAEMLMSLNTPGSIYNGQQAYYASFVVCQDSSVLKNGTNYGAEHAIVAWYDSDYMNETATHVRIGHPILPKRNPVGLVAGKPKAPFVFKEQVPDPVR